jgi:hypothetical protein
MGARKLRRASEIVDREGLDVTRIRQIFGTHEMTRGMNRLHGPIIAQASYPTVSGDIEVVPAD